MIADASTATFTIDTGDIKKTVAVYALGMDDPQGGRRPGPRGLQAPAPIDS